MKICKKCGNHNNDDSNFCNRCGFTQFDIVQQVPPMNNMQNQAAVNEQGNKRVKKKDKNAKIAIIICASFLIISFLSAISQSSNNNNDNRIESTEQEESSITKQEEVTADTVEETMIVESEETVEETIEETLEEPEMTEEEYKALCQEYKYKDVVRTPENYIGEKIHIKLKVSSVKEAGLLNGYQKYYFAWSNDEYDMWFGDEYIIMDKRYNKDELKILEGDIIEVWGEIANTEHTTSLIVNSKELFSIDMRYSKLISD